MLPPMGFLIQPVPDRVIKYTFQRKRKKESLSSPDGNANAEESILKKKAAENGPVQMEKSSSITESSRDSRRVAQVARQVGDLCIFLFLACVSTYLDKYTGLALPVAMLAQLFL